jgi:predicted glycoside hydrolase/deacetylase ChbG (UPF0249 family)
MMVLHVDDVGMCHGANTAYLELMRAGAVTCGAVMVPCPWFPEIAAEAAADPSLDLGIHLTLTAEWKGYRWGPVSAEGRRGGVTDADGYFPRTVTELRRVLVPDVAEIELRAQIDRAMAAGIRPTHLDTHMGTALLPELREIYVRLGREYRVPVLLPPLSDMFADMLGEAPAGDNAAYRALREATGQPQIDAFLIPPSRPQPKLHDHWRAMLAELAPGVTYAILHCNAPGEIEAINPGGAQARIDEYELYRSRRPLEWLRQAGVIPVGMRAVRDLIYPD